MSRVLQSSEYVVKRAKHVQIDQSAISQFCDSFDFSAIRHWLVEAPFDIGRLPLADGIAFLFVLNSVSFCYWDGSTKWKVHSRGKVLDGTWAMIASLGMAVESGIPICDPVFLRELGEDEFAKIMGGNTLVPLAEARVRILNELGRDVSKYHRGSFYSVLEVADYNAMKLVDLLSTEMHCFMDSQVYQGRVIHFLKRAQLLASDLNHVLSTAPRARQLTEVAGLTACADYKLPQVLRRLSILHYSDSLADRIDNRLLIDQNSEEEVEIRACTIWAVEGIRRLLSKTQPDVLACEINDFLWLSGQESHIDDKPYHLTLTTAY